MFHETHRLSTSEVMVFIFTTQASTQWPKIFVFLHVTCQMFFKFPRPLVTRDGVSNNLSFVCLFEEGLFNIDYVKDYFVFENMGKRCNVFYFSIYLKIIY